MYESSLHAVNLKNYITHVAKLSAWEIHEIDGAIVVLNSDKSCIFNYVFQKDPLNIYNEETAKKVLSFVNNRGYSLSWPIETGEPKRQYYQTLLNLEAPSSPKKALLELNDYSISDMPPLKGLEFIPVDTYRTVETLDIMTSVIFVHEFGVTKQFFRGMATCNFEASKLKFFLLRLDGSYIGCCGIFIDGEVAGLYTDGILANHRGRGFGTAMLEKRVELAKKSGCKYAIAHCMRQSVNLYKRFGFRMIGSLPLYSSSPER